MIPIIDLLEQRVSSVLSELTGNPAPAVVRPSNNPKFGDYQANGVMGQAKKAKQNPRQLAEQVIAKLDVSEMCEPPQIAGPGFINFRLRPEWLSRQVSQAITDSQRLGIDPLADPPVTVVDFSSPNLAKEMHVGHLRSTIIGDVIARVLEFWYDAPEKIIRQNHVGDWGTQFGMLIAYIKRTHPEAIDDPTAFQIADLESFYQQAKKLFDDDATFKQEAYHETVALHNNEQATLKAWKYVVAESRTHCQKVYDQLNVRLNKDNERGESSYNDRLPDVIKDLHNAGMLVESDGAQCVFMDQYKNKDGDVLPLIVQKSDGAFLYATTDLAAVRYRTGDLKAQRIIYVTDARQKLHFDMVFSCARKAGWASEDITLEHVPFGSVQGDDGKPFKTRSGGTVKLKDLLDEAVLRAGDIVNEKNANLDDATKAKIAAAVGVGAVKYADLSNNLVSDYVFDWNKMLAMEGNTAPYMQYAYARVQSIFRKGDIDVDALVHSGHLVNLTEPEELTLGKLLLRYSEVIENVARDLRPHLLTTYLFDLAQAFSSFYANCPVLKAEGPTRTSRLLIAHLTAKTIHHGLSLLGIATIDQM
ncbi:MAG: arginine--tRNA ligase [Phycisphaerae bacterium]|nr:arginine--tRNA ligase [Phycisphaerae bacterium]